MVSFVSIVPGGRPPIPNLVGYSILAKCLKNKKKRYN